MNVTLSLMRKDVFTINDSLTNRISFWHIALFLATLPFDRFYSELILISLAIHTIIHLKSGQFRKILRKEVLILQSVYLLTLVCTLYTSHHREAFSLWERQLAIFLFPLVLIWNPIDISRYRNIFLSVFALSCTATILYLYYDAFHIIFFDRLPASAIFSSFFINQNFSKPINLHATYLSMYAGLSFIHLLLTFKKQQSSVMKWLCATCLIILLAGLIQLGSKAVLPALLIIVNIIIPFYYEKGAGRKVFVIASVSVSAIIILAIFQNAGLKERYYRGLQSDFSELRSSYEISDPRLLRWELALKLVKDSPIIGYGTGEETALLKETYFRNKLYNSYLHDLNAHNEYISFLLRGGIFGLAIYMLSLLFGILAAIKNQDILFLSFMILIGFVSFSENYLDVNKGIFLYAFFFSFFVLTPIPLPAKRITRSRAYPRQPFHRILRFYQ